MVIMSDSARALQGEAEAFDFKATIKFRLGDGTELVVHRSALADIPFFKARASFHTLSAADEGVDDNSDRLEEIELPFCHDVATAVLRYAYSASLVSGEAATSSFTGNLSVANILDVLEAVNFLGMVSALK